MIIDILERLKNIFAGTPNARTVQGQVIDQLEELADNISATTTTPGIVELATDEEAKALTSDAVVLTPGNLGVVLGALGDIKFIATKGVILLSPNETAYRIIVGNDGSLDTEVVGGG